MYIVVDKTTKIVGYAGTDNPTSTSSTWCSDYLPLSNFDVFSGVTLPPGFLVDCFTYISGVFAVVVGKEDVVAAAILAGTTVPTLSAGSISVIPGILSDGITQANVDVTITAIAGAISYELRYKTATGEYSYINVLDVGDIRITGLIVDTVYYIGLRVNTIWGLSDWTADVSITTTSSLPGSLANLPTGGINLITGTLFKNTTNYLAYSSTISVGADGSADESKLIITGNGSTDGMATPHFVLMPNMIYTCSFHTDLADAWSYIYLQDNHVTVKSLTASVPAPVLIVAGDYFVQFTFSDTSIRTRANMLLAWTTGATTRKIWKLKIEEGNKATAWSPAPVDVQTLLDDIADDAKFTGVEKANARTEWDSIANEYPTMLAQSNSLSISTERDAYAAALTALARYLNNNAALGPVSVVTPVVGYPGWARYSITGVVTSKTGILRLYAFLMQGITTASYPGISGHGIIIHGAQVEYGEVATAYEATTTAPGVRNLIYPSVPDGTWLNSNSVTALNNSDDWMGGSAGALLMELASTSTHYTYKDVVVTPGTVVTVSIYANVSMRTNFRLQIANVSDTTHNMYTNFDMVNYTYGARSSGGNGIGITNIPLWIDDTNIELTTDIVPETFRTTWASFYNNRTVLQNKISLQPAALIKIGGRNLLASSLSTQLVDITNASSLSGKGFDLTGTNPVKKYSWTDATTPLKPNTEYTSSFKAYVSTGTYLLYNDFYSADPVEGAESTFNITTTITTYTWTFTTPAVITTAYDEFRFFGATLGTEHVYVTDILLEEGNKASTWTPAPEDVQVQFDDISSDSKFTGVEKANTRTLWESHVAEHDDLNEMAGRFSIVNEAVSYNGAMRTLARYLNNGTIPPPAATITDALNGWLKITVTGIASVTPGPLRVQFHMLSGPTTTSYAGVIGNGLLLSGARVVQGGVYTYFDSMTDWVQSAGVDITTTTEPSGPEGVSATVTDLYESDTTTATRYLYKITTLATTRLATFECFIKPMERTYIRFRFVLDNVAPTADDYLYCNFDLTAKTVLYENIVNNSWNISETPLWINDTNIPLTQDIVPETFRSNWADFHTARSLLITKASTVAKELADAAQAQLNDISSDATISQSERSYIYTEWKKIYQEASGIKDSAVAVSVLQATIDAYWKVSPAGAYQALATYLIGLTLPADPTADTADGRGETWCGLDISTPITATEFRSKFTNYYDAKQAVLDATALRAAELAKWAGIANIPYDKILSNDSASTLGFNPSFDMWSGTYPDGWLVWGTGATTVTKSTTVVRNGINSIKIVAAGADTGIYKTVSFATAPMPVDSYIMGTIDIYLETVVSGLPGILVRLFNTSGLNSPNYVNAKVQTVDAATGAWQRVTFTATLAAGARIYGISIYIKGSWTGFDSGPFTGTCYFDGLTFGIFDKNSKNVVQYGTTFSGTPLDGDLWCDTSVTPNVWKIRVAGAWQISANNVTNPTHLGTSCFRVMSFGQQCTSLKPYNPGFHKMPSSGAFSATPDYTATRSYNVTIITRATGAIVSNTNYDVFTNTANATAMANALNAITSLQLVVVITYDEPQTNRMFGTLPDAMYRCGASPSIYGSTNSFKFRGSYILIGMGGCGEGNGYEVYSGDADSSLTAWCEASFSLTAGALTVTGTSTSISSVLDLDFIGDLDATLGANSTNLAMGIGTNMLSNSTFTGNSLSGWTEFSFLPVTSKYVRSDKLPGNTPTLYVYQTYAGSVGLENSWKTQKLSIRPSTRYEFFVHVATYNCSVRLELYFYDADGVAISGSVQMVYGTLGTFAEVASHSLNNYTKLGAFCTSPSNAASVVFAFCRAGTQYLASYSFMYITQLYLGQSHAGQLEHSPWVSGSEFVSGDQIPPGTVTTPTLAANTATYSTVDQLPGVSTTGNTFSVTNVNALSTIVVDSTMNGYGLMFTVQGNTLTTSGLATLVADVYLKVYKDGVLQVTLPNSTLITPTANGGAGLRNLEFVRMSVLEVSGITEGLSSTYTLGITIAWYDSATWTPVVITHSPVIASSIIGAKR